MFCAKEIPQQEYTDWKAELTQVSNNVNLGDEDEDLVVKRIEKGMTFLGVTGVEDMLQDEVRATMEALYEGNISVWVLTGDKKETAKCIAIKTALATSLFSFYDYDRELEIFKRDIFNDQIRPVKKQKLNRTFAESDHDIDGSNRTHRDVEN